MKQATLYSLLVVAVGLAVTSETAADEQIRVATYNIFFLKSNISNVRAQRIRDVITELDADVIGLQEIADRAALERVFDAADWTLIIDDDSGDQQDLAIAVRKGRLNVIGLNTDSNDLDADDDDFLFPSNQDNFFFPNRRDVLIVLLEEPQTGARFHFMTIHAKSRSGGRDTTDNRREGAARDLIEVIEQQFDGVNVIVVGDFNDNPDDRSLNILEAGDPNALAGPEQIEGPFMINITEPLVVDDHVSWGLSVNDVASSQLDTRIPGSRAANNASRGTSGQIQPILFDQILVSPSLHDEYAAGSATVFSGPVAVEGSSQTVRASDHVPVSAVFDLTDETGAGGSDGTPPPVPPDAAPVQIVSLLPNPAGQDLGNEWVTIKNVSGEAVDLEGWRLRDRAGHTVMLSGTLEPDTEKKVELSANEMPLNNSGDDVALLDTDETIVHQVTYSGADAGAGDVVTFGR